MSRRLGPRVRQRFVAIYAAVAICVVLVVAGLGGSVRAQASDPDPGREPGRISEASHAPRPQPEQATPADRDLRPVYLGLGLVVLGLVFVWNRKQRERLEREARLERPAASGQDDDGDDLHAAARGDEGADDR